MAIVLVYARVVSRKKTTRYSLPTGVMQPLDFHQKFLMTTHEHGDFTIVTASILRTNVQLTISHVTKAAMHLMEKYPLLTTRIYRPTKNSTEAYFVKVDPQHLIDTVVVEVQSKNWKLVMESELLKKFSSKTGPLWNLSFLPQIDNEKSTMSYRVSQIMSQAKSVHYHTSVLIFRFHHSIVDGKSVTMVVGDAVTFLHHILSEKFIPREHAWLYGPLTQYLPKLSWKEAILLRLKVWFAQITFLRMNTNTTYNSFIERMGAEIMRDKSVRKRTRIISMEWSEDNTRRLLAACKKYGCTVQGAVQTAVGTAMVEIMSKGQHDFRHKLNMFVSVDLRPRLNCLAKEAFGVYSGFIVVTDTYAMGIGNRKFWKLARETSHTIRLKIKYGEHVQFNRLDFGPERLIDIQCKLTAMVRNDAHGAGRTESNVLFSNVGNCPHLALNSDVVQHLANFTAVSAHNMGASFSIYITTFNGKMFWTLNYFENVVSEEVAQSFIELINNILMQQISQ